MREILPQFAEFDDRKDHSISVESTVGPLKTRRKGAAAHLPFKLALWNDGQMTVRYEIDGKDYEAGPEIPEAVGGAMVLT